MPKRSSRLKRVAPISMGVMAAAAVVIYLLMPASKTNQESSQSQAGETDPNVSSMTGGRRNPDGSITHDGL